MLGPHNQENNGSFTGMQLLLKKHLWNTLPHLSAVHLTLPQPPEPLCWLLREANDNKLWHLQMTPALWMSSHAVRSWRTEAEVDNMLMHACEDERGKKKWFWLMLNLIPKNVFFKLYYWSWKMLICWFILIYFYWVNASCHCVRVRGRIPT